jgi:RHS repeat-associated protein
MEERFAGHPLLAELGLVQMGARFYLPSLGRFLTPDALAPAGRLAVDENVNALTLSYAEEGLRLTHNGGVRSLRRNPLPGPAPGGAAAALGLAGGVQLDRYGYANYRPVQEADPSGHNAFWVDIDLETAQALLDALLGDSQGNPGLLNLLGLAEGALDGIGTVTAALVGLVATPVAGLIAGLAMYVVSRQVGATLDGLQAFAYALRNAISAGGGDQIRIMVDHGIVGDQLTVSRAGGGTFTVLNGLFDRSGDLLIGWMMAADHGADVMWELGGIVYYWRRAPN